jgi:hypothetical protein
LLRGSLVTVVFNLIIGVVHPTYTSILLGAGSYSKESRSYKQKAVPSTYHPRKEDLRTFQVLRRVRYLV